MAEESTTPNLVELLARLREAVNRRDFDAIERLYAPDAVYGGTELRTFEGAAAIRGDYEDAFSSFEEIHGDYEEVTDLGNGVTFVVINGTGRPVGSSGELRFRFVKVAIWTNGVIERDMTYHYADIDEARAAAERLAEERG